MATEKADECMYNGAKSCIVISQWVVLRFRRTVHPIFLWSWWQAGPAHAYHK